MTSVLLSYARADDEPFVQRLWRDLRARGFDVWWDRQDMPSRSLTFLQEIRDAISARDRLVLVVGPVALGSDYVEAEWRWALDLGKPVNPVLRLGDYPDLPDELRLLDVPDFRDDGRYPERLETLARQLSEPVPPMGKLVGVPSLPQHLLERPDRLRALKDAVLADLRRTAVVTGEPHRHGLHGMGGIGKSVLATMLARDTEVRRAFPDGVVWLPVGRQANPSELMRSLARSFGAPAVFETEREGKVLLERLLAERAVLLVLDDVWEVRDAEAFDILGPRCRLVLTTRDASMITAIGGTEHRLQLPAEAEAEHLLARWAGLTADGLPAEARAVLEHCGRLPLALSLCGAMAREGIPWADLGRALDEADLGYLEHDLANYPHRTVLAAIRMSVEALAPGEAQRFAELRVFPPDETVPEAAVVALWGYTGGLPERAGRKLLTSLGRRALVQLDGVAPRRRVSLHDLVYDYTAQGSQAERELHQCLLATYWRQCSAGWATGPDDGYYWQHLVQHLLAAERSDELFPLLTDYTYLDAKLRSAGVQSLIEDYERAAATAPGLGAAETVTLGLLAGALRLCAHVLARDHCQLVPQLWGRLCGSGEPGVQAVLAQARALQTGSWLRCLRASLTPPGGALQRTLAGHRGPAFTVAVTPDGRRAVSASGDRTLRVWDLSTGETVRTLSGHAATVRAVALTPDGRRAVSGSDDGTLKVWGLENGELVHTLTGHSSCLAAVAATPDGRRAVSAGDSTVRLWDLSTGAAIHTLAGHTGSVLAMALSADGRVAVSGAFDGVLKVWDLEEGVELRSLAGHHGPITAVALTPDGRLAVSASRDHAPRVWDVASGQTLHLLTGHDGEVSDVVVTSDGRRAVSASSDNTLRVWDLAAGIVLHTAAVDGDLVARLALTADERKVISGSGDGTLRVWDLATGRALHTFTGHTDYVSGLALTSDGRRLVSASHDRTLKVWDLRSGQAPGSLPDHSAAVSAVAVAESGQRAVSGDQDGTLVVWDLATGEPLHTLVSDTGRLDAVAVTADGRRAVAGADTGVLTTWNLESGAESFLLSGHSAGIDAVAVCPDGARAISASGDGTLRVWDLESGAELRVLRGHTAGVNALAVGADGRRLVSASNDATLRVWDLESGEEVRTVRGHREAVATVALMGDGRRAVSTSQSELRVWDLASGALLLTLPWYGGPVQRIALTGDDTRVICVDTDGALRICDPVTGELVRAFDRLEARAKDVAVTADGRRAVLRCEDDTLRVCSLESGRCECAMATEGAVRAYGIAPDDMTVVAGDAAGRMHFLRLENVVPGPPLRPQGGPQAYEPVLRRGLGHCRDAADERGVRGHLSALSALLESAGRPDEAAELAAEHDTLAARLDAASQPLASAEATSAWPVFGFWGLVLSSAAYLLLRQWFWPGGVLALLGLWGAVRSVWVQRLGLRWAECPHCGRPIFFLGSAEVPCRRCATRCHVQPCPACVQWFVVPKGSPGGACPSCGQEVVAPVDEVQARGTPGCRDDGQPHLDGEGRPGRGED